VIDVAKQAAGIDLSGRTALVTGAAGGLGRAIAVALAAAGADLALHDLRHSPETELCSAAVRSLGRRALVVAADLADWDAIASMITEVEADFGGIDVLVNNAGILKEGAFLDMSAADIDQLLDVDLRGVIACIRYALPGMLARGRGAIVNVASQLAFHGGPDTAVYAAAKAGVVGLTRALAREFGPAIKVNAVAPAALETPMTAEYDTSDWRSRKTRDLVIGRLAAPDEVAPTIVFLAADASNLFHGQTLHVNGGGYMA
jgi:3-oxoacyl-[acyl-carrier protein] reductase